MTYLLYIFHINHSDQTILLMKLRAIWNTVFLEIYLRHFIVFGCDDTRRSWCPFWGDVFRPRVICFFQLFSLRLKLTKLVLYLKETKHNIELPAKTDLYFYPLARQLTIFLHGVQLHRAWPLSIPWSQPLQLSATKRSVPQRRQSTASVFVFGTVHKVMSILNLMLH
jgi:hypothetical protein